MSDSKKFEMSHKLAKATIDSPQHEMIFEIKEKIHDLLRAMNQCVEASSLEEVLDVTNGHLAQFKAKFRLKILDSKP